MQRRVHTLPKKIRLTKAGHDAIAAWATAHDVSFSAAVETLCRMGMGEPLMEALSPALISTLRREIQRQYDRLIRLLLYNIIESGAAARLAGAAVYALRSDKYEAIKRAARTEARKSLIRSRIGKEIREVFGDGDR